MDATNVATFSLISAGFLEPVNPDTLDTGTFYLLNGDEIVNGSVKYITSSKMAVFHPANPLKPATIYTATITTGVRDLSGKPLSEAVTWSFSIMPVEPLSVSVVGGMNIYFGDLHNHTGYSDGIGTPADAFATAKAAGVDFLAVTDHGFMLTEPEWQDISVQATAATVDGQFVGLSGFEFTHASGHLNVFNTDTYVQRTDPAYADLEGFYAWLIAHPTAFAQFNHPSRDGDSNFNNFLYYPAADQKIIAQELQVAREFYAGMDAGWHLGTLKNRDVHDGNWGCCPLMGLVAPNLTRNSVLEALKKRRTFFVSPFDSNMAVIMRANGYWMGSAIPDTSRINFTINIFGADSKGDKLRLNLYENGSRVASTSRSGSTTYTWEPSVTAKQGHYYFVEAYQEDWEAAIPAYSSPIWVEHPPVAMAGVAQTVPAGAVVTLDGNYSWDPDDDALAYHWIQEGSPTGVINQLHPLNSRAIFTAPITPGDYSFRLTVTDSGGLSSADTTMITVTELPFLQISKDGPKSSNPDGLITYTLSITNIGTMPATGVVVTDTVPAGTTYVGGGTMLPEGVVQWLVDLAANGGATQVTFSVTAAGSVVNKDYGASCATCVPAAGRIMVITNGDTQYLPLIVKEN